MISHIRDNAGLVKRIALVFAKAMLFRLKVNSTAVVHSLHLYYSCQFSRYLYHRKVPTLYSTTLVHGSLQDD